MADYPFVTLDVFTDQRFGGNPLVVFPDARGMDTAMMMALSREFNLSEAAFVLPADNPENTARVRIFTADIELDFAGHPNVGVAWVLAGDGRDSDGLLRFEEQGGLVEVTVERQEDRLTGCRVSAPQAVTVAAAPGRAELAACAGLSEDDIGEAFMASVALATACVPVSREALGKAKCDMAAFRAIQRAYPEFGDIFLLYLFARDGDLVHARMFAPLSGTNEDPATGSAACAMTGALLAQAPDLDSLTLSIVQGVEMRRPSRMRCDARRDGADIWTSVTGDCVQVLRGVATV
ncbi:MAG: PhzF family phenazine biosynthesis protein [Polymorphobacter sp.]